jgi:hypothetical protein
LALASAVLSANGKKAWERLEKTVLLGELALDEQCRRRRFDTVLQIKRWHCPQVLVGNPKPFAAGGKDIHGLRVRKDCFDHVRRGVENMLAVVDYQQPDSAFQRFPGRPPSCHRLGHRHVPLEEPSSVAIFR